MKKSTDTETKTTFNDMFDVRKANDWISSARTKPIPKMLFGEFWREGELAIMFADTGTGKSMLAVQIAESIARGRAIEPMLMNAEPQPVLYFDFELSEKQFEMRYAEDQLPEEGEFLTEHYEFSDNFYRVEIDLNCAVPDGSRSFDDLLQPRIEELVRKTGAKVAIIDNLTYLKRSNERSSEAIALMMTLNRLKKAYGLSILVLAHTPKRNAARALTVNDLQGSKTLSNFADNIFAIGKSKLAVTGRYIKHIKLRSSEMFCDSPHVPMFYVTKLGGNFLGFKFARYAPEGMHLLDVRDEEEWKLIDSIKKMTDNGFSIRAIAARLKMSKTSVHRLLQMWTKRTAETTETDADRRAPDYGDNRPWCYFPGCEEYWQAAGDPRFGSRHEAPDEEQELLLCEQDVIVEAHHRAFEIFKRTGEAPPLGADEKYNEFLAAVKEGRAGEFVDQWAAEYGLQRPNEETKEEPVPSEPMEAVEGAEEPQPDAAPGLPAAADESETCEEAEKCPETPVAEKTSETPEQPAEEAQPPDGEKTEEEPQLRRAVDKNGNEIFIEKEDDRGRPKIWYQFDQRGNKFRFKRDGLGTTGTLIERGAPVSGRR